MRRSATRVESVGRGTARLRIRALTITCCLAASCDEGGAPDDTAADTATAGDATGGVSTMGQGSDAAADSSSGGGGDSTGEPPSYEEYEVLCGAQLDKTGCDGVPPADLPEDGTMWCAWLVVVPVALDAAACEFGEPVTTCILQSSVRARERRRVRRRCRSVQPRLQDDFDNDDRPGRGSVVERRVRRLRRYWQ